MVGHRLLVGISYLDGEGNVAATEQFCGRVLDVGDGVVIVDRTGTAEPAVLPADAAAYRPAPAGTYRLASRDDVVVDPDFITTWRIRRTPGSDADSPTPG
jgi:hypothetical protein